MAELKSRTEVKNSGLLPDRLDDAFSVMSGVTTPQAGRTIQNMVLSVRCELVSTWRSCPYPIRNSGHEGLPLSQSG